MSLYDELKSTLYGRDNTFGFYGTDQKFKKRIEAAERQAASEGRYVTGYRDLTYYYGRGRSSKRTVEVPIFSRQQQPIIQYRTDPNQAKTISRFAITS